ncbi:MAG: hypothetical protein K2Q09_11675, partial [Phycisphaerales bacterium]|nr:hypothetical protein [Phycisphaerales bacterium]
CSSDLGNGFNGWSSNINTISSTLNDLHVQETIPANSTPSGDFANRHFGFLSTDGGASAYAYDGTSSFSISYRHRMVNSTTPTLPGGNNNTMEGGLWFLQGGVNNPYDDGGVFTVSNRTMFVGGMGAGFSLLAEGNGSNVNFPPLTAGGWYDVRFDYWAPGALGAGSPASYQVSYLDETTGNYRISNLTSWDQGGAFATGLQPGTAIGFRFQNVPVAGVDNNFDGQYTNIVVGAVVPAPSAAVGMAVIGLAGLRRRR